MESSFSDKSLECSLENMSISSQGSRDKTHMSNIDEENAHFTFEIIEGKQDGYSEKEVQLVDYLQDSSDEIISKEQNGKNFQEEDDFSNIKEILGMCNPDLTSFFDRFHKAYFINDIIPSITMESIAEVFKEEIGLRIIFNQALLKFLGKENEQPTTFCQKNNGGKPNDYIDFGRWNKMVR